MNEHLSEKELDAAVDEVKNEGGPLKVAFGKNAKNGAFQIAKYLIKRHSIETIGSERIRELFIYQDGIYIDGVNILKHEIQEILEDLCSTHYRNEIIEKVKDFTISKREKFIVPQNLINLNNGVYDISADELLPHGPQYKFFSKLPVKYDPKADCPAIRKFLSEILDEPDIAIIQEWFGYCLYRKYFIKKAIILVGEGNTGKTTLLKLLETFIGRENTASVSLQKLSHDKFGGANLYNKHVSAFDDLSFKDINDNGAFKMATGGGIMAGEYKFGNEFPFENYAKLTFACNKIPDVKDWEDPAYFDRWIIIHFRKEIAQPDKFLTEKITKQTELSGLLNFILLGLKRLMKNEVFSYPKDSREIKIEMQRSGSPIAQFAHDCLENSTDNWINKEDMHRAFETYAKSRDYRITGIEDFGKKLPRYATYMLNSKKKIDNKNVPGWRHVKIKNEILDLYHEEELSLGDPEFLAPLSGVSGLFPTHEEESNY